MIRPEGQSNRLLTAIDQMNLWGKAVSAKAFKGPGCQSLVLLFLRGTQSREKCSLSQMVSQYDTAELVNAADPV